MKKKLTVNSLAFSNIKRRKKEYALMIIGIILAMTFSSSIIYFACSTYMSLSEKFKADYGTYNGVFFNADPNLLKDGEKSGLVENVGWGYTIGYAYASGEYRDTGTAIARLDGTAKELVNPILEEGAFPQKEGEIAIERAALMQMGVAASVGDKITVCFQKQCGSEPDENVTQKTYVLTGILNNKRNNVLVVSGMTHLKSLPAAFVSDKEKVDFGGKESRVAYYNVNSYGDWMSYTYENSDNPSDMIYSPSVSDLFGYNENGGDIVSSVVGVAVFVVILLFASCVGVVNAFNTNLAERKKQIGMYRALGATGRQIFNIYGREALFLSVICVPVSIAISHFATKSILSFLTDDLIFKTNISVLVACGVFSVLCVMLACAIPLLKASKITPLQAIRNIEANRTLKKKKIKSKTEFKVSHLIAARSLTFSKMGQVTLSVFLTVTIVISCYAFSFLSALAKEEQTARRYDYNIYLERDEGYFGVNYPSGNNGFTEAQMQMVLMNRHIKSGGGVKKINVNILFDKANDYLQIINVNSYDYTLDEQTVTADNYKQILFGNFSKDYTDLQKSVGYGYYVPTEMLALDTETTKELQNYVVDGEINIDKINSGEEIILFAPEKIGLRIEEDEHGKRLISDIGNEIKSENNYLTVADLCYKAGDVIEVSVLTDKNPNFDADLQNASMYGNTIKEVVKTVKIGAVINDREIFDKYGLHMSWNEAVCFTTVSGLEHYAENIKYKEMNFKLEEPATKETDDEVMSVISSVVSGVMNSDSLSVFAWGKEHENTVRQAFLTVLAVVLLCYMIVLSVINNILIANIRRDRKKIGTLRAVGANKKELYASYIL